jgi:ribose-phosphate pyrophosphokinase
MIILNGKEVKVEHFPDGTQRIVLDDCFYQKYNNITWKYEKEEELSALIYITKHLKNFPYIKSIDLTMFYLPNARMDRIHDQGEVFTLKGFADVINWLEFDRVEVLDVHSNVGAALLNRVYVFNPREYIDEVIEQISKENLILYFPDTGSSKRYSGLFSDIPYCYGEKNRDWNTGKILGLKIRDNGIDLKGKKVLMIDDIISYGGSLYYSAKVLKECGVDRIYAYASHTENSVLDREKGTLIKSLEDGTVERLFTTDSLFTGKHDKITVMEV